MKSGKRPEWAKGKYLLSGDWSGKWHFPPSQKGRQHVQSYITHARKIWLSGLKTPAVFTMTYYLLSTVGYLIVTLVGLLGYYMSFLW